MRIVGRVEARGNNGTTIRSVTNEGSRLAAATRIVYPVRLLLPSETDPCDVGSLLSSIRQMGKEIECASLICIMCREAKKEKERFLYTRLVFRVCQPKMFPYLHSLPSFASRPSPHFFL